MSFIIVENLKFIISGHATKILKSPFESRNNFKTNSLFTIFAKLLIPCKNLDFNLTGNYSKFGQGVRT